MNAQLRQNGRFTAILMLVLLLHGLVLLIPAMQQALPELDDYNSINVQLTQRTAPEETVAAEPEPPEPPPVPEPSPIVPRQPVELAELPSSPPEPEPAPVPQEPPVRPETSARILSRQFDYQEIQPLFGVATTDTGNQPDFYFRKRPGLDDVLNEPSLQLPLADTRIYLVDSYSPGISGGVERFFDQVTVPFGWTTKNNTRIQCAWVLVISGCSWGHVSLFQKKAKRRKTDPDEEF